MSADRERVFAYQDYRDFLREHFRAIVHRNERFSYGAWSRQLGMRSTSTLTKILNGAREPGPETVQRFISYFKFPKKEAEYFRSLVLAGRKRTDETFRGIVTERITQLRGRPSVHRLTQRALGFFSRWYFPAIYEMVKVVPSASPEVYSQKFRFPVSPAQVREALNLLQSIGLVTKTEAGYRTNFRDVENEPDIPRKIIRAHHKETLTQTIEALDTVPVPERDVLNVTLVVPEGNFEKAREAIREFKDHFVENFSAGEGKVMRIQIQFIPLTQDLKS